LQDAAAARQGSGKAMGHFAAKELRLAVVAADARGKPSGAPLGSISLNLADYAAADGRTQQPFTLTGARGRSLATAGAAAPKLLLTIACRDASHIKAGGPPLVLEPSLSSLAEEAAGPGPGSKRSGSSGADASSTFDLLSAVEWPGVAEEDVLLAPGQCRSIWRQFMSDSTFSVQQVGGCSGMRARCLGWLSCRC
jgi:hypothetical protein